MAERDKTYPIPEPIRAELERLLPIIRAKHEHGYLFKSVRDLASHALRLGLFEVSARYEKLARKLPEEDS